MATKPRFRVGLVQMAMSREPGENLEKAVARLREAARAGAEVVCLPELYRSPYFCQNEDDPLFHEKFYFTPGDLGFQAFDTQAGRIGTLICWDQWYPEGARLTALRGAAVLFYPTAIGWHPHEKAEHGAAQRSAWQTIQRAHAIANGVFVAVVNRVGHEVPPGGGPGLEFWGSSFLADPFGVMVAEATTDREEI